jgi:hypothetical protein
VANGGIEGGRDRPRSGSLPFPFLSVPARTRRAPEIEEFVVAARGHLRERLTPTLARPVSGSDDERVPVGLDLYPYDATAHGEHIVATGGLDAEEVGESDDDNAVLHVLEVEGGRKADFRLVIPVIRLRLP